MTKAELGEIISKGFALYLVVGLFQIGIFNFFALFVGYSQGELGAQYIWPYAFQICIHAFLILVFWYGAKLIGQRMSGESGGKEVTIAPAGDYLVPVFVAAGCLLIINSTFGVSHIMGQWISKKPVEMEGEVLTTIVRLSLALVFIFGAYGLKNIVLHFRGMDKER